MFHHLGSARREREREYEGRGMQRKRERECIDDVVRGVKQRGKQQINEGRSVRVVREC